ncbi:unnamed protein product, partial [Amoebophrya sp. A120]
PKRAAITSASCSARTSSVQQNPQSTLLSAITEYEDLFSSESLQLPDMTIEESKEFYQEYEAEILYNARALRKLERYREYAKGFRPRTFDMDREGAHLLSLTKEEIEEFEPPTVINLHAAFDECPLSREICNCGCLHNVNGFRDIDELIEFCEECDMEDDKGRGGEGRTSSKEEPYVEDINPDGSTIRSMGSGSGTTSMSTNMNNKQLMNIPHGNSGASSVGVLETSSCLQQPKLSADEEAMMYNKQQMDRWKTEKQSKQLQDALGSPFARKMGVANYKSSRENYANKKNSLERKDITKNAG